MNHWISVRTNPFHVLDHEGRPAGAVLKEIDGAYSSLSYVGATMTSKPADIPGNSTPRQGELRQLVEDRTFEFETGDIRLAKSAYYLRCVKDGALLAADEATAKAAGIPFVDPTVALSKARKAAIDSWVATYGEMPSFAVQSSPPSPPSLLSNPEETHLCQRSSPRAIPALVFSQAFSSLSSSAQGLCPLGRGR